MPNLSVRPSKRIGRLIFVVAFVVVIAVVGPPTWRFLRGFQDRGSLPDGVYTCGRAWLLSPNHAWTKAEIVVGGAPLYVVNPGPAGILTTCPWPDGSDVRDTVIFAQVDDDAYLAYELQGGP